MKKVFFLLMVALLVIGCGGGGETTTSSSGIPGGDTGGNTGGNGGTITGPVGYITVTLPEGVKGPSTLVAVRDGAPTFQALRNAFRVVAKRSDIVNGIDEEGNPYSVRVESLRVVQDSPAVGTVRIAVPAGAGYTVEVLTYDNSATLKHMLEYGITAPFDVVPGANLPQDLKLYAVSTFITMTVQDAVTRASVDNLTAGFAYNVNVVKTVPLREKFYLTQTDNTSLWPIDSFVVGYGTDNGVHMLTALNVSFTAPNPGVTSNLYLQGQFFIDDSLLSDSERIPKTPPTWSNWRIDCPDPAYNVNVGVPLLLPGDVPINFI